MLLFNLYKLSYGYLTVVCDYLTCINLRLYNVWLFNQDLWCKFRCHNHNQSSPVSLSARIYSHWLCLFNVKIVMSVRRSTDFLKFPFDFITFFYRKGTMSRIRRLCRMVLSKEPISIAADTKPDEYWSVALFVWTLLHPLFIPWPFHQVTSDQYTLSMSEQFS